MPQILVNGELVDISQEQYDALGQGTQATTTATDASSFEQYALLQAKIDGVKQLAAADAAVVDATNISPEFQAELDRLQAQADALAGDNLAEFQAQYQDEAVFLQAQGATNLDALRQELLEDPQPAIIAPGSVPVSTETIGVGGEEITAINTTNNSPQQESAVTNESFDSDIEPVNPTVDPQVNLPADIAGAPDPTVAAYFQNKAELEAFQKVTAVEEGDRATFVANPEERAAFVARLEENNQRLEAELEQKGLLSAVQQAEEQDRIENVAAQPPIGSLAELYPDDEPTVVSVSAIETEAATELTAEQTSADAEVSAFEEQQTTEQVPVSEVEAVPENVDTAADPEVPPGISTEQIQSNQEAFAEAQATGRENPDGSVTTVDDTGVQTTLFPDGAKTVSDASGTTTFNAEGQATSHTSPTVNGFSETTFADGSQTLNKTIPLADTPDAGALTISQDITPDGTVVSETTAVDLGLVQAEQTVTNGEIVGQRFTDNFEGEQEILSAERDVQQTEQQLATAEAELAGTQQEIVDTVRAGGEPTTAQLETLAAQESEVAALEEQLTTDEQTLVSTQEAQGVDPDPTTLTAAEQAADPEVTEPAAEEVPLAEIDTGPAPLTDAEIAEYRARTATKVNETGAKFQEPFVSDEAAAAEAAFFQENPEAVRAVIEAPPPPTVESETEELDLSLEEVEERASAFEDTTELTEEQEAADPEIAPEDDFVLSAADIDGGEDLDQDPGPGYGDVDEPLDPDILDRANEVEVDPYEDVLGRDLTEEEIQAEDNPVDYDLEEEIDPYNAISDRDAEELSPEDIQAEDNPVDYVLEEEIDPYNAIADNDLTEEEIQAEDNPIDYDTEDEIDPYSAVENSGDPTLTDEEIDAARADQQIEFGPDGLTTLSSAEAARQQSTLDRARAQAILQQQRKQANDGDWRVRLRLAPLAEYLYKADQPGILQPLAVTDGVVFPYTPQITTAYKATYNSYNLTHSNYRGFFYQGSQVDDIQLNATFTAQDTAEANYLLAVIHFFRSVTKMFYGQDATSGAPPPLVFLQGLGEYQFNLAPCVVASFNYVLPADVDYIRAGSPNINGTNLLQRRDRQDLPTNPFSSAWTRINNVLKPQGIKKGAIASPPAPPTLGTNRPTYVPTKMEISIILHPMQSREQVSKQFSLKQYANGDLLKGGFW